MQSSRTRLVLSTDKKSVSIHMSEWPFLSGGAFFMSVRVSAHPPRPTTWTSIRTMALIQGGFFKRSSKDTQRAGQ